MVSWRAPADTVDTGLPYSVTPFALLKALVNSTGVRVMLWAEMLLTKPGTVCAEASSVLVVPAATSNFGAVFIWMTDKVASEESMQLAPG